MRKWYRRRGGWIPRVPRTPWIKRRGPLALPPVPVQPPVRTIPIPMPKPTPVGRGRGTIQERETAPKTEYVTGPTVRPQTQTKMRTKTRRWVPPKIRLRRDPWQTFPGRPQKRKRKGKQVRVKPMGTGTSFSSYRERAKYRSFRSRVAKLSPRQQQLETDGVRTTWDYSKQGRTNFSVMSKQHLLSITNNIPGYSDSTRWFLKDGYDEFFMSNQSNANCYIRIYHYYVRRDIDISITALMDRGLSDIVTGTGTTPTADNYGVTPSMSAVTVSPFFRLAKSYFVELAAGRTHKHTCKYVWNKEYNQEIYRESLGSTVSTEQSKLAGWTRVILFLMHGEPVNDISDKSKVVPSSGAIDIVRKRYVNYYYGEPVSPGIEYINNLPLTGVTENVMESATDEASAVEKA